MQFPVPQFTDVEDRIIGALSFKQFGIIFVASLIVFVVYAISKNIFATIVTGAIFGIPALALAFMKLNGRPLYANMGNFIRFLFGPKIYTFHKQAQVLSQNNEPIIAEETPKTKDLAKTAIKIKELNYLLEQHQSEEELLLQRINESKLKTK